MVYRLLLRLRMSGFRVPITKYYHVKCSYPLLNPISKFQRYTSWNCKSVVFYSASNSSNEDSEDDSDSDSEATGQLINDVTNTVTRRVIEYDDNDPVINRMINCLSLNDLLSIIDQHKDELGDQHLVQAVLVLFDLQKTFMIYHILQETMHDSVLNEYKHSLTSRPEFQVLLEHIEKQCSSFTVDELVISLLYLHRLGVCLKGSALQKIISLFEGNVINKPETVTLSSLSRFIVTFKQSPGLWTYYTLKPCIPLLEKYIDVVTTASDIRCITISLIHLHKFIHEDVLVKYLSKISKMLDDRILNVNEKKTIIRILYFLQLPTWINGTVRSVDYMDNALFKRLCLVLKGHVHKLDVKHLINLQRVIQNHLEPANMLEEVQSVASKLLLEETARYGAEYSPFTSGLLTCVAQFSPFSKRMVYENYLSKEMNCGNFAISVNSLYKILRFIKTSDVSLCNAFWSRYTELLVDNMCEKQLLKTAHRYMYFNNNLGGTYRYYPFERTMIGRLLEEIKTKSMALYPCQFTRGASFILAYGKQSDDVESVVEHLVRIKEQLSPVDCLYLSRGIEIMFSLNRKKPISCDLLERFVDLDTCLNECAWRHLRDQDRLLPEIILLLRTYINRKGSSDTDLFLSLVNRLEEHTGNLSSRLVRDITFVLMASDCLIPRVMDRLCDYLVQNKDYVHGDTVEKVLTMCYTLSYVPHDSAQFADTAASIITRDMEHLSGLALIQATLALSHFQRIPKELVNCVFTVEFLERMDEEIAQCYSKARFPLRVRYALMELNRSVCLDLPELDIPWFHSDYCKEIAALDPLIVSPFHAEVNKYLSKLVGGEPMVQKNVYSPYGHKINFQVVLDHRNNPIPKFRQQDGNVKKIAVVLQSSEQFTNYSRRLKGQQEMRLRHLEMMGYRVIAVAEHVWNAMYLTEPHLKMEYLRSRIWPER